MSQRDALPISHCSANWPKSVKAVKSNLGNSPFRNGVLETAIIGLLIPRGIRPADKCCIAQKTGVTVIKSKVRRQSSGVLCTEQENFTRKTTDMRPQTSRLARLDNYTRDLETDDKA